MNVPCGAIMMLFSTCVERSWMVPRTLAVMLTRGLIFHRMALSVSMSGLNSLDLCLMAFEGNLSW